ncbi:MAG TPA: hypothetical protein VI895_08175 [Bdellovibrionota bacterium]|nr:hypothetical protein [Bdellovibrionota bacterium]
MEMVAQCKECAQVTVLLKVPKNVTKRLSEVFKCWRCDSRLNTEEGYWGRKPEQFDQFFDRAFDRAEELGLTEIEFRYPNGEDALDEPWMIRKERIVDGEPRKEPEKGIIGFIKFKTGEETRVRHARHWEKKPRV